MAHPFFDSSEYPWHREDAQELFAKLLGFYDMAPKIQAVYEDCKDGPTTVHLAQEPDLIWREVLRKLCKQGRIEKLCERVLAEYQKGFHEVVEKVTHAVDDIRETVLDEGVLVLDRDGFREHLQDLKLDENPKKVLLVRGGPQSGKTHCRHLFQKLAVSVGAVPVYLNSGFASTLEEVLGELFSTLGEDMPGNLPLNNQANTSAAACHRIVCQKLMKIASEKNKVLWVAMDDLGASPDGAPLIESTVKAFFDDFTLRMVNPAFSRWFRLLLIHYPEGNLPTKWDKDVWGEDRPDPAHVQHPEVEAVVKAWLRKHDRVLEDAKIKEMSAGIITQADAVVPPGQNQESRLRRIHDGLVKIFESFKKQPA